MPAARNRLRQVTTDSMPDLAGTARPRPRTRSSVRQRSCQAATSLSGSASSTQTRRRPITSSWNPADPRRCPAPRRLPRSRSARRARPTASSPTQTRTRCAVSPMLRQHTGRPDHRRGGSQAAGQSAMPLRGRHRRRGLCHHHVIPVLYRRGGPGLESELGEDVVQMAGDRLLPLMHNSTATALLVLPWATSVNTSVSRAVRPSSTDFVTFPTEHIDVSRPHVVHLGAVDVAWASPGVGDQQPGMGFIVGHAQLDPVADGATQRTQCPGRITCGEQNRAVRERGVATQ